MTTMRWFRTGGPPRGTPAPGRPGRRASALLMLAAAVLSQAGCQSWSSRSGCGDPCGGGGCGGGGGLCNSMKSLRERIFHPRNTYIGPAVPVETAPPLEYGAPAPGVITPAPVVTPGAAIPAPAETLPQQLEPIPRANPDQPSGSGSGTGAGATTRAGAAGKANYETRLPRYRSARPRNESVARANVATPESTSRSARGSAAPPAAAAGELNPLDNLPPLDLPRDDLARGGPAPEAPPAAAPEARTAPATAAAEGTAEVSVAPGIRRFVSLGPRLDGGSLPSTTGPRLARREGLQDDPRPPRGGRRPPRVHRRGRQEGHAVRGLADWRQDRG